MMRENRGLNISKRDAFFLTSYLIMNSHLIDHSDDTCDTLIDREFSPLFEAGA